MITAAHVILYSRDADADRAFLKDVLGLAHVDSGGGWLIFKLPPGEVAVHPTDDAEKVELYLMCDDLDATKRELAAKGVAFTEDSDQGWGILTTIRLPGAGTVGLYQPRHATAYDIEPD